MVISRPMWFMVLTLLMDILDCLFIKFKLAVMYWKYSIKKKKATAQGSWPLGLGLRNEMQVAFSQGFKILHRLTLPVLVLLLRL